MMHALILDLELLDEVVVSRTSATTGQHRCLPFIPGSNLLGAIASTLYDERDGRMFDIFHSGRVRFGDARPLTPSLQSTWPVPLAWHGDKGGGATHDNERWRADAILNLAATGLDDSGFLQPQQIREAFVGETDERVRPRTRYRMKTAIARSTGSAADGQLFGYEALARGQRFRATLSADDAALLEPLRKHLRDVIYLGRSRSAQYGRAKIVSVKDSRPLSQAPLATLDGVPHLVLWLASDLAARDAGTGMPTYTPGLADLGLDDLVSGVAATEKTFVRTRRYSPFNAKRRAHDLERQVIVGGSVLCYRLERMPDPQLAARLAERLAAGLGEHREAGLGEVVLDAVLKNLLLSRHPVLSPARERVPLPPPAPPDHPLVAWLQAGEHRDTAESKANGWAEQMLGKLLRAYASARRYNGVAKDLDCGPVASQWGRVQDAAIEKTRREDLASALFEGDSAICKANDEVWGMATGQTPGETYRSWLAEAVGKAFDDGVGARGVIRLAALARADVAQHRTHKNGDAA